MRNRTISCYEWDALRIGDKKYFGPSQLNALERYFNKHNGKFYSLIRKGLQFKSYVGILQVGQITIEILPKVDRAEEVDLWRSVLLDMLRECDWMQVKTTENALLKLKHHSILDAYLELFLNSTEALLREGLLKKYRTIEENSPAYKGKLMLTKHIRANIVHEERFYTSHPIYDRNNIFNRILLKAIKVVPTLSASIGIADKAHRLLMDWPEVEDVHVSVESFDRLIYTKKNERYRDAILMAKMLLLNYQPDLAGGKNNVLAILFDMNELWEEFVFRRLKKEAHKVSERTFSVHRQQSRTFWQCTSDKFRKAVRLDIIIEEAGQIAILDTKWKLYENKRAIDNELKQMYVYAQLWGARQCFLLFPSNFFEGSGFFQTGTFHKLQVNKTVLGDINCDWIGVNVLADNSRLSRSIGSEIMSNVKFVQLKQN